MRVVPSITTSNASSNSLHSIWQTSVLPVPEVPISTPIPSARSMQRTSVRRAASIARAGKYCSNVGVAAKGRSFRWKKDSYIVAWPLCSSPQWLLAARTASRCGHQEA